MKQNKHNRLPITKCWLYAIASPSDLALRRLSTNVHSITVDDLSRLTKDLGNFKLFSIKKHGKDRAIQEPKRELQRIHRRIHDLLSRVQVPDYLHSAVAGKSYLSNAAAHSNNVPLVKIDVKKFFASVPRNAVVKFFHETMKCRLDVARLLGDLLTFSGYLPTGGSASPIIAYYAFKPMFDEIEMLAKSRGLKMTCYVDDMTFSGIAANSATILKIRETIAKYGLKSHKARKFSSAEPKVVTGICVTQDGSKVPNKLHLKIKMGFDALSKATTPEAKRKALWPLLGRLEAAGQIDSIFKARAATLRASMRPIAQPVGRNSAAYSANLHANRRVTLR